MTANQLAAQANRENKRANLAKETETSRSNRAKERETARSNREQERLTKRGQNIKGITDTTASVVKAISPISTLLGNDPAWYDHNPNATKQVANVSYQIPVGAENPYLTKKVGSLSNTKYGVPGIMKLPFVPTLGGTNGDSAVNTAAFKMYTWVRHVNSGSRNYEAVDYMMYCLAADSVMTNVAWINRILNSAMAYHTDNKYRTAKALLLAEGFTETNIANLTNNIAQYAGRFNTLIASINAIAIPRVFDYITRHVWMANNYFTDASDSRGQIYFFSPRGYYTFKADETTSDEAGALEFATFKPGSMNDILNILESQINAILQIEDLAIMSGDTLKAYGDNGIYKVPAFEFGTIPIIYSEEVLSQIEAADCFYAKTTDVSSDVYSTLNFYQKSGFIHQGTIDGTPGVQLLVAAYGSWGTAADTNVAISLYKTITSGTGHVINKFKPDMEPRDTMVTTRLQVVLDENAIVAVEGSKDSWYPLATVKNCGSEIILDAEMMIANWTSGDLVLTAKPLQSEVLARSVADDGITQLIWSSFSRAPKTAVYKVPSTITSDVTSLDLVRFLQHFRDFAIVENNTLANMHSVALLSQFITSDSGVNTVSGR